MLGGIRLDGWTRGLALVAAILLVSACGGGSGEDTGETPEGVGPAIVVTTPILGSIVRELVGDTADVEVLMPNGVDPHDWQPSAKEIEKLSQADLVVVNGLHLEEGLEDALAEAEAAGATVFEAGAHVQARTIGEGEPGAHADEDDDADHAREEGAPDPHLWMDPLAVRAVVEALAPVLEAQGAIEPGGRAAEVAELLTELDAEIDEMLAAVPEERRKLVTGHESMGYFADRYGFTLVGAVIPSLSSQAEASASELAELKRLIQEEGVAVVLTELGTPTRAAETVADEAGAALVELPSHGLPEDGSYFTFMRTIASTLARALGS